MWCDMSEFFDSKDYGEYFRELECRVKNPEYNKTKDYPENAPSSSECSRNTHKRKSKRSFMLRGFISVVFALTTAAAIILFSVSVAGKTGKTENKNKAAENQKNSAVSSGTDKKTFNFKIPDETPDPGDNIISSNVLMINLKTGEAVSARNATERAYPASTTKIMTALVAAEHITDYSDTFTMSLEITDKIFLAGATAAGFSKDEQITMTDLLYGTILPSGGDAALGLAYKISGSEEAFVELMNEKAAQLGLSDTHFTNTTGLFDTNHYTTAADLAVIVKAAMDNPVCRQVLSTHPYTTTKTPQHPNGILLESTLFSSMYGTEPETATITGGKTGYVNESGYCIASFGEANETKTGYICITLNAKGGKWPAINDQIALYKTLAK